MLGRRGDQGVMCPEGRISLLAQINQLADSLDLGSAGKHSLPRDLNYPGDTQDTQVVNYGALPLATHAFFTSSPSLPVHTTHVCLCGDDVREGEGISVFKFLRAIKWL